jgi:hypothetical protein
MYGSFFFLENKLIWVVNTQNITSKDCCVSLFVVETSGSLIRNRVNNICFVGILESKENWLSYLIEADV